MINPEFTERERTIIAASMVTALVAGGIAVNSITVRDSNRQFTATAAHAAYQNPDHSATVYLGLGKGEKSEVTVGGAMFGAKVVELSNGNIDIRPLSKDILPLEVTKGALGNSPVVIPIEGRYDLEVGFASDPMRGNIEVYFGEAGTTPQAPFYTLKDAQIA